MELIRPRNEAEVSSWSALHVQSACRALRLQLHQLRQPMRSPWWTPKLSTIFREFGLGRIIADAQRAGRLCSGVSLRGESNSL